MSIVFLILIVLAALTGLVTIFLTTKIWHWTQVTLVAFVLLFGITALFLAAEVFRIHRNLRSVIPKYEQRLAAAEEEKKRLLEGTDQKPGIVELEHELRLVTRQRGRVWRKVVPADQVSVEGVVAVSIGDPQPHGLEKNAIVYLFEDDKQVEGEQYLGDFRVIATSAEGVTLEPILRWTPNQRELLRLGNSRAEWRFYETMPADRHEYFEGMSEEQIRELFNGLSADNLDEGARELLDEAIDQYVRHGQEASDDDDPLDIIYHDDKDNRVDPEEDEDKVVKRLYDRPLRDYEYLFGELSRQLTIMLAEREAETEDHAKIKNALESAEKLQQFRTEEINNLTIDLDAMKLEQQTVEAHRDQVLRGLSGAQRRVEALLVENSNLADDLQATQMKLANLINLRAPAPGRTGTPAP